MNTKLKKEILDLIKAENLNCTIEEFPKKVNWIRISRRYQLSESFMEKHWKDLHKDWISGYQKLSEPFMEKHWKDLHKDWISRCQKMTESFIEKHKDELYLDKIPKENILEKTSIERIKELEEKTIKLINALCT